MKTDHPVSRCLVLFGIILFGLNFFCGKTLAKNISSNPIVVANKFANYIRSGDFKSLSLFIHETKGLRFSPHDSSYNKFPGYIKFSPEQVKNFMSDKKIYVWGFYDGSGEDIKFVPKEYYKHFIYDIDYIKKARVNLISNSNSKFARRFVHILNWFPGAILVQYDFEGTPETGFNDFKRLNLVLEQINNKWFLTGILHGEKSY